ISSTPRTTWLNAMSASSASTRLAMFLARSPMRSRSFDTRNEPTMSRRSTAIGWRRAMVRIAFSSIARCRLSTDGSSAITFCASSTSRRPSAITESAISFSARPPISATMRESSPRSASKALMVCSDMALFFRSCRRYVFSWRMIFFRKPVPTFRDHALAEAAGDVVLGTAVARRGEHFARQIELHQLAQIHEGGEIGHPRRLLHVVGHDDDGVVLFELVDQLL